MENSINPHSVRPHTDSVPRASLNDNDPENRPDRGALTIRVPPRPTRPPLMILLPPRRPCVLCSHAHAVLHSQHPNQPTRCQSCQTREWCSSCFCLKKRKHFHNIKRPNQLFNTCKTCREKAINRVRKERDAAHAVRLKWCVYGSHRVNAAACTSAGNILRANCLPCLTRRREARAARAAAASIDHVAEQDPIEDREGVVTEPIGKTSI